jgi:hypothetical protein
VKHQDQVISIDFLIERLREGTVKAVARETENRRAGISAQNCKTFYYPKCSLRHM